MRIVNRRILDTFYTGRQTEGEEEQVCWFSTSMECDAAHFLWTSYYCQSAETD